MRKFVPIFALLVMCLPLAAKAEESLSPYLTDEEHAELLQLLDESNEKLMGLIAGLSEAQWTFKQNPDRWSVGQCTEHIVRSERSLLPSAKAAMSAGPDAGWAEKTKGKTDLIRRVIPNRQPMGRGGATAPVEIRPTEDWDRARALSEFRAIRDEVKAYAESIELPIKEYTQEHPFAFFGWLSAHDWLIYIPLHTIRHSKQIIEVQEDPNYPE